MKTILAALAVLGLAACGEEAPKPVASQPPAQAAQSAPPPLEPKTAEAPRPDPDKELAGRVKRALEGEPKVQAAAIDVTAADGVVTLWGTAATVAESKRAAGVASGVEGVKSVANKLAIVKGS